MTESRKKQDFTERLEDYLEDKGQEGLENVLTRIKSIAKELDLDFNLALYETCLGPLCNDCKENVRDEYFYMLKDELWKKVVPERKGFLHIKCFEKRLGRELMIEDFDMKVPINSFGIASDLLKSRRGQL